MKFVIEMEVTEEEMKRCIISAMQKRYGDDIENKITIDQIKPFEVGSVVLPEDVFSMLLGCCLGQLLIEQEVLMIRIE